MIGFIIPSIPAEDHFKLQDSKLQFELDAKNGKIKKPDTILEPIKALLLPQHIRASTLTLYSQAKIDIAISVLCEILPFFSTITKDLQDFLDEKLHIKLVTKKSLAYTVKQNLNKKAAETAIDIEEEPVMSCETLLDHIKQQAALAVRHSLQQESKKKKAAKKQNAKCLNS